MADAKRLSGIEFEKIVPVRIAVHVAVRPE